MTTWRQTNCGIRFDLLSPTTRMIDPRDISLSLSRQCRFAGHTSEFYSVAEHSIRVMYAVPAIAKQWALLHDAAEAYTGDIVAPMHEVTGDSFKYIERIISQRIRERFKVRYDRMIAGEVKRADLCLLATEARDLLPGGPIHGWTDGIEPLRETIQTLSMSESKDEFEEWMIRLGICSETEIC